MKKTQTAFKNIFKKSKKIDGISIRGYDLNGEINYSKILDSYLTTGGQATNFAKAVEILKKMKEEKAFIYLGYTSNMITTGIRETIKSLVKNKFVDYLVTTAGGIEEDFIKCFGDFKLGEFNLDGKELRKKGINRAGNILIPNELYEKFEKFVFSVIEKYEKEIKTPSDLILLLAKEIKNEDSVYYLAYKNNIKVYCPTIMDGSLGDIIYFYKNYKNKNFSFDIVRDTEEFNNSSIGKKKTGIIIIGGGVVKHSICNCNLYRNGSDYAVYINSQQEFDCSDSGARPDEAVSWGKISTKGESIKIFADATLVFPLLVAKAFFEKE
ncbi:MAG: deoxyhypusine synthase [Candidatus Pacearchaeota archaeon]